MGTLIKYTIHEVLQTTVVYPDGRSGTPQLNSESHTAHTTLHTCTNLGVIKSVHSFLIRR